MPRLLLFVRGGDAVLALEFNKLNQEALFWQPSDRVLLAVSAGVDSMVLLALFLALPEAERPYVAVAHFNHQLREASLAEEQFLRDYCQQVGVPFFSTRWQSQPQVGMENHAREARYAFFAEICERQRFDCLVTAHHGDDQAETILMKVSSGSQLQNLVGIRPKSQRGGLVIYRPLLAYAKSELVSWATEEAVPYLEDASNASDTYLRNRIRHRVIPQFKAENANFLKHIHNFVKQITYANDIIKDKVDELWPQVIHAQEDQWVMDVTVFRSLPESYQYMLLVSLWQEALVVKGVVVNEEQISQALALLQADVGGQELHLPAGWRLEKRYDRAFLRQVQEKAKDLISSHELTLGQGLFLSPDQWLAFEEVNQPVTRPSGTNQWQVFDCSLPAALANEVFTIRKPQAGDRLCYNAKGNHKKVNRVFIDAKIPREKREETWLVCDATGEILWIAPIRKSYLSIVTETDKIHYRLIYLKSDLP